MANAIQGMGQDYTCIMANMNRLIRYAAAAAALTMYSTTALAQTPTATASTAATSSDPTPQGGQAPPKISEPTVTVIAQKEPADPQKLPVSVTAVTKDALKSAGVVTVSDAALYAPNTFI